MGEEGALRFDSARPLALRPGEASGYLHKVIEEFNPRVFIVDPISNLINAGTASEVKSILTRLIDYLKMQKVSTFLTDLTHYGNSLERTSERSLR